MRHLILAFLTLCSIAAFGQELTPTDTKALLHIVVTDFQGQPRKGEMIFFESSNSGKSVSRKTDESGKTDILLPKGDTYKIKYQAFLNQKESSTIEVPDKAGKMEATLSVQMENMMEEVIELDVHFETAKATIRPESNKVLDELVASMNRLPTTKIELAGHTDSDGSADANLQLSRDRAAAVKAYLSQKGISPNRITTVGYGESKPVADNASESGKAKNRRTEVRVTAMQP
ncbi:MAG: OmpA family protein [Bacteroidia bacterium]